MPSGVDLVAPSHQELPLEDTARLARRLRDDDADRLVLLAAWTRVDDCEADPARALSENGAWPGEAARVSAECGVPALFTSTDYVFSGRAQRAYREDDAPSPINTYGRSKWEGEERVRAAGPRHRIVRASGLYGPGGPDFPLAIRRRLQSDAREIPVVEDQVTAPTYVDHLAEALWPVILGERDGTFHLSAAGETSWCNFARAIASRFGDDPGRIVPTSSAQLARPAARPSYSILDCAAARAAFGVAIPDWRDGLDAYWRAETNA